MTVHKVVTLPLNCPFCDEPAYPMKHAKRQNLGGNIICTKRQCIMGHEFWSVEEVAKDQEWVERRITAYKRRKWNEYMREYRNTPEFKRKKLAQQYHREVKFAEMQERLTKQAKAEKEYKPVDVNGIHIKNDITKYDDGDVDKDLLL